MRLALTTLLTGLMVVACAETPPASAVRASGPPSGVAPAASPASAPASSAPSSSAPTSGPSSGPTAAPSSTTAGATTPQQANPERYGRDRDYCQSLANEQMKTRRTVDYGRSEVFQGQMDRYGTAALPDRMSDYSDTRKFDSYYGDCMANRGYPNENPINNKWWNRGIKF